MMKVKFIINPSSGKQLVQNNLDKVIGRLVLEKAINSIDLSFTQKKHDAKLEAKSAEKGEYDAFIVVGGDGTLNEVVSGVVEGDNKIPIAIIPAGTVNDFANWLNIPKKTKDFAAMLKGNKRVKADVGRVNNQYFINVAAGGLLTDVGYKASLDSKTVLGKLAYYIEGMKELPKQMFRSLQVDINCKEYSGKEEIFMFLIANTPSVGGFKRIAPKAQINDGLLDVCIIKKSDLPEVISLLVRTMKGEHINHPNVEYIQTSKIELSCSSEDDYIELDIDGEKGCSLPAVIEVIPGGVEIFVP
jgi:diacylglycerol kinase (ATP)